LEIKPHLVFEIPHHVLIDSFVAYEQLKIFSGSDMSTTKLLPPIPPELYHTSSPPMNFGHGHHVHPPWPQWPLAYRLGDFASFASQSHFSNSYPIASFLQFPPDLRQCRGSDSSSPKKESTRSPEVRISKLLLCMLP